MRPDDSDDQRAAALATALGAVRSRIARACEVTGRDAREITLVAVTKTYPGDDIAALIRLGLLDIGESKDQEARAKRDELGHAADAVRWHMIGQLQSNKAKAVAGYASAIHSVDRPKLVAPLAEGARGRAVALDVFVQVSLDDDPSRGGALPSDIGPLADAVANAPTLRLRGLMAVPPMGSDPSAAFARLHELSVVLQADHPDATALSAGMSADLDLAIAHGSTHVRVGTALLGRRGPVVS